MVNRMTTSLRIAQLKKWNFAILPPYTLPQVITLTSSPVHPPDSIPGEALAHILCFLFTCFSL